MQITHLSNYFKLNKNSDVPLNFVTKDGFKLGAWVYKIRSMPQRYSPSRKKELNKLNFNWTPLFERVFKEGFERYKKYVKENKTNNILSTFVTKDGFKLGQWQNIQRRRYKENTITKKQLKVLRSSGFIWNSLDAQWELNYEAYKKFVKDEKTNYIPASYKNKDGLRLGGWVFLQRKNQIKLNIDKRKRLEKLGFIWKLDDKK